MKSSKIELRDVILGGQDGLVNVLGLSLGLYAAHADARIILIAGLAAGLSESVSMGAVTYTSGIETKNTFFNSLVVGLSALLGAVIPIFPFFFLDTTTSICIALILGSIILFWFGISKAKQTGQINGAVITSGKIWKSGFQILFIGLISAFAGFLIGFLLKV